MNRRRKIRSDSRRDVCEECDLELGSADCAWTLQGYLTYGFQGTVAVFVVAPDGGRSRLPEVETEAACGNLPGWYAEGTRFADYVYVYTTLTFRLCPASCSEHQGDAGVSFLLGGLSCPIR